MRMPDQLYRRGENAKMFERTASRLDEMQSEDWLEQEHVVLSWCAPAVSLCDICSSGQIRARTIIASLNRQASVAGREIWGQH